VAYTDVDDGVVIKTIQLTGEEFRWSQGSVGLQAIGKAGCGCGAKVFGRVQKPFSIRVEIGGQEATLTIPTHRTFIYEENGAYQVDVKDDQLGSIVRDDGDSRANRDAVLADYEDIRKANMEALAALKQDVALRNFKAARATYAKVVVNELFASDLQVLDSLYLSIPEAERPINTYTNDVRWEMRAMILTFGGVNFDAMTVREFIAFVDDWGSKPFTPSNIPKQPGGNDETYLFRFFNQVGVPENTQVKLLSRAIDVRIDKFIELAKRDADARDASFEDTYNTEAALNRLIRGKNELGHRYIAKLRKRLAAENPKVREYIRHALVTVDEIF
jgi:hypothetical protein